MYKNVEVFDKEKFKNIKFDNIEASEVGKNIGLIPLGFNEVFDISYNAPIIITAGDDGELSAFTGISHELSIFHDKNIYTPIFTKTYPFLNITVKDENDKLNSVIGIDNSEFVGKNKKTVLLNKEGKIQKIANDKISLTINLNKQRDVSKKIVSQLKKYDLLLKKDLRVNVDNTERVILKEFYIVNREKLITLEDEILATWARKGWMSVIDCHIKSLANFQKVLSSAE